MSWKLNMNLFIVITIEALKSFYKSCSQVLRINNYFSISIENSTFEAFIARRK